MVPAQAAPLAASWWARPAHRRLAAVALAGLALRIALAVVLPPHHDEAYYWLWAQRLDWSYVDHPPLVAWMLYATTRLGDDPLWMRLGPLALGVGTTYVLYLLGRDLFDEGTGLRAAILFQVTPLLWMSGLLAVPDAALFFAWTAASWLLWHAVRGRARRWLAGGLLLGVGLLAKLSAALLGAGVVIFVWLRARAWLRRPEPYAGALLALGCLAPVVWWNLDHQLGGARFLRVRVVDWYAPRAEVGIQHFLLPYLEVTWLLAPAFLWGLWTMWRRRGDERFAFLWWTSVPVLAVTAVAAPLGVARAHWLGPAHLAAAVALGALWSRLASVLAALTGFIVAGLVVLTLVPSAPIPPGVPDLYGWAEVAATARVLAGSGIIATDSYEIASRLAYYTRLRVPVLLFPAPHPASVWPAYARYAGAGGVAVSFLHSNFRWERCFSRAQDAGTRDFAWRGQVAHSLRFHQLEGLRPACQ